MNAKLREAFRFHLKHAGYASPPGRAACALSKAKAEAIAEERGWEVHWEWDDTNHGALDGHEEWCGEKGCQHEVLGAVLHRDGEPDYSVALWGIIDADRTYRRVVEAELFEQALYDEEKEAEEATQLARMMHL